MTYAGLAALALTLCLAVAVGAVTAEARSRRRPGHLVAVVVGTAAVLVVLTVVFDSAMAAADLFRYDERALLGPRLGLAPVEDLAWPLATALLLPSVLTLLDARSARRVRGRVRTAGPVAGPADDRPAWRAGVRQVVGSSRPLSWINTAYPFAVAYLLAGGRVDALLVVGTAYFLVPYNLLMYGLNDVWDHASDLANPRKGGIEGVVLDTRWHRTTVVAAVASNVPFLVAVVALTLASDRTSGPAALVALTVSVAAVVAYSAPRLRFKERPGLDSVTSATHFVGPAVVGVCLAGGTWTWPVVATVLAFVAWGCASHAFGAVQDVRADRSAGIASVATVLGARTTVRLSAAAYAVAAVLLVTTGRPASLAAAVPLAYLASVWPFRDVSDEDCEAAHRGWRRFLWLNLVAGFAITQGLIVVALGG